MQLTEVEYIEAVEEYAGFCRHCDDIVTYGMEPDADDYRCPECGSFTLMGMENALLAGRLEFTTHSPPQVGMA